LDKQIELQTKQIQDLNRHIQRYEQDIDRLTADKEQLIDKLNDLSQSVAQKIDQIEELEALLKDKEKIIDIMNKRIIDKKNTGPTFTAPKGDVLDQMLSHYVNQANCPVPIRKLGNGFYLFGTKKIYAKILNGKLVIRVGGGYMIIEEFIATYADSEMAKIAKLTDEQLAALAADSKDANMNINPSARLSMYRTKTQGQQSPQAASKQLLMGKPNSLLSGTTRGKSMKKF